MNHSIVLWKVFAWSPVILVANMIVGNLLYVNPLVSGIFKKLNVPAVMKETSDFGGLGVYIGLNAALGVYFVALFIFLFVVAFSLLPGNWLAKGVLFALAVILIKTIPEAFNQFMLFRYPVPLIMVQLINSVIAMLILGILTSFVYTKTGAISAG